MHGNAEREGMSSQNNQTIKVDPSYREALNLLIEKFLSFDWCIENLTTPFGFEKSSSNDEAYVLIAISNFSHLSKIGKDIKSAMAKAGFNCRFIEENSLKILSIIEEIEVNFTKSESEQCKR